MCLGGCEPSDSFVGLAAGSTRKLNYTKNDTFSRASGSSIVFLSFGVLRLDKNIWAFRTLQATQGFVENTVMELQMTKTFDCVACLVPGFARYRCKQRSIEAACVAETECPRIISAQLGGFHLHLKHVASSIAPNWWSGDLNPWFLQSARKVHCIWLR